MQKLISACGVASRRTAEGYLEAGRVTVNGKTAQLGDKADLARDSVAVDGVALSRAAQHTYLMLYKPKGYVTTLSDEKGRKTVAELTADCGARVWPVGRLDLNSEGLLLLTDDGALTNHLIHPSHEIDKEYFVWVKGPVEEAIPILTGPMTLDDTPLYPARVRLVRTSGEVSVLSITIHEGKNRQVRRMCDIAGLTVTRLKRVREGDLALGDLQSGHWRRLTPAEVQHLGSL